MCAQGGLVNDRDEVEINGNTHANGRGRMDDVTNARIYAEQRLGRTGDEL